jgi:hypothetical protein
VPCVGSAGQRRRPQLMFCVSVKLWRHSDTLIWVPSFWTLRMSENYVWGRSGTLLQRQGSYDLDFSQRAQRACQRPTCIGTARARPIIYSLLILMPVSPSLFLSFYLSVQLSVRMEQLGFRTGRIFTKYWGICLFNLSNSSFIKI